MIPTSFPPADEIARALNHFPEAEAVATPFLSQWAAGATTLTLGPITAEIIIGDARQTLARLTGKILRTLELPLPPGLDNLPVPALITLAFQSLQAACAGAPAPVDSETLP